jgi:signal transduction histidine kinase
MRPDNNSQVPGGQQRAGVPTIAAAHGDAGQPVGEAARALCVAARIASTGDSQQVAAALAREACLISGADVCTIRLLHCPRTRTVATHDCRGQPTDRSDATKAHDDASPPNLALTLSHNAVDIGRLDLYWNTDPPANEASGELIALRDLGAAQLGASLERDAQRSRLRALDDLTTALRQQVHEYANRMQVLSGLHELGDDAAAHRFLAEMVQGHENSPAIQVGQIEDPIVAGTLVALMRSARRRRIRLELDADSQLERLPSAIDTLDLVTVVANIVDNALDAVADQDGDRRRVHVSIAETDSVLRLVVRDWGPGVHGRTIDDLTRPGSSTKHAHHGVGLTLVRTIVDEHHGHLRIEPTQAGLRLVVSLPWS